MSATQGKLLVGKQVNAVESLPIAATQILLSKHPALVSPGHRVGLKVLTVVVITGVLQDSLSRKRRYIIMGRPRLL